MTAFLNYIIEANICLMVFLAFYILWLRNETDFYFSRFYILSALCFSVIFPLFHFEGGIGNIFLPSLGNAIPTYFLPEFVIYGTNEVDQQSTMGFSIWNMLIWIYFSGIFIFSFLLFFRISHIFQLIKKQYMFPWNNCKVAKSTENLPTFSFFNFILIGQADKLSNKEIEEVLRHENVHVKSYHTLDILLINLLEIIFWFNPFIKIYKKILTQLHEFEADAHAVENHDLREYCHLLARVALQSADFSIANHFNKSLTLKRITMMQTVKSKIKPWKLAALAMAIPATFFFIACQDQVMEDVGMAIENASMAMEYPEEVQKELEKLRTASPEGKFNVVMMDENGMQKLADLEKKWGSKPASMHVFKNQPSIGSEDQQSYVIVEFNEQVNKIVSEVERSSGKETFTIVEEQPTPQGGIEQFYQYINQNLQYPAQARRLGIEGKVYVQFIVSDDGSIKDVEAIKGIGGGCDAEAVRIITESEKWNPGIQRGTPVNVRMVVPINFALN